MDRFLVYGFLEEINHFTREHAESVAEEFSNELAGDFLKPVLRERALAKSRERADTDFDDEDSDDEAKPRNKKGNGHVANKGNGVSIDDTSSSPLEKRLRGLDQKLKKLGEKSRQQRNR